MKYIKIFLLILIFQFTFVFANNGVNKKEVIKNTLVQVYKIKREKLEKFDKVIGEFDNQKLEKLKNTIKKIKSKPKYSKYNVKLRLLIDYFDIIVWEKYTEKLLSETGLNQNDLNSLKLEKIKSKQTFSRFDKNTLLKYKKLRETWIKELEKKENKSKLDNYLSLRYKQEIDVINDRLQDLKEDSIKTYFVNHGGKFVVLDLSYSPRYSKFQGYSKVDYSKYKYLDDCGYKEDYYAKEYCNGLDHFYVFKKDNKLYKIRFNDEIYFPENIKNLPKFKKDILEESFKKEILVYNPDKKEYYLTNGGYKIEEFNPNTYEFAVKKYGAELQSYMQSESHMPPVVSSLVKKGAKLHNLKVYKYLEGKIDIYKGIGGMQKSYDFYIDKFNGGKNGYQFIGKQVCVSNLQSEKDFEIYKVFYKNYSDLHIYYTGDSGCEYLIAFGHYGVAEEYIKFDLKKSVKEVIYIDKNKEFVKNGKRYKVIANKFYTGNNINMTYQEKFGDYNYMLGTYLKQVLLINGKKFYLSQGGYKIREIK